MAARTHVGTIAIPDTGMMLTVAYETDDTGATVILTTGRIGQEQPDATAELGASHVASLMRSLQRAVDGIVRDRSTAGPPADVDEDDED